MALTYDAAAEFSHANNPNGVWSYGWEDESGFHLFTEKTNIAPGVYFWTGGDGPLGEPTAGKNEGTVPFIINGSTTYGPGDLGLHAGRIGQRAILRWTAPEERNYLVNAHLRGGDPATTANAEIRNDGSIVASALITGESSPMQFVAIIAFDDGEHVDFVVGFGNNGTFWFDTILTEARITALGEIKPSASLPDYGSPILLLAISLSTLIFLNHRGRMASAG